MASNYSDLERSIDVLVKNFYQYAGKKEKMNKKDFKKMLSTELNQYLTNTQIKEAHDSLIKSLDDDADGKISFDEYWMIISNIAETMSQKIAFQN